MAEVRIITIIIALVILGIIVLVSNYLFPVKNKKKLEGFRGWLILPIIVLIIASVSFIISAFQNIFFWLPFFFLDIITAGFFIYTSYLVFSKKKKAIKWLIFIGGYRIFYILIINFFLEDYSSLPQVIIISIVWITYFVKSKRVKNTFVK